MEKPSDTAARVMSGALALTDAPQSIQSMCQKPIFDKAVRIIRECQEKHERQAALAVVPELLRPHVMAEVQKLWARREKIRLPTFRG